MDMNRYSSVEQMVGEAIRESAESAEIVEIEPRECAAEIRRHLADACDGDVVELDRGVHEFWGAYEDQDDVRREWRVHVRIGGAS